MFSCLMFWMILSFEETDALSNVKVMNLPNGVNITATYLGFKKHKNLMIYGNSFKGLYVQSKAQCASECMAKNCNSFGTLKNKPPPFYCWLYKGNPDTNHYYAHGHNSYEVYEVQNTCTKNPLICEHGSVCIPNFNNNTYYCRWCFPPYYGKHCNLTAEEVNNKTIPEDIRTGKNASCKSLRNNFGVKSYGVYDTYPWRDWRKVAVRCSDGFTLITRISAHVNGTINHTISTITQLSDMQGERFRFSTTALNVLYKLIRFRYFYLGCENNGVRKTVTTHTVTTSAREKMLKYFIGESDHLPDSCTTFKSNDVTCEEMENKKWSKEGVPFESRIYNQVIRFASDVTKGYSVEDHQYGCFGEIGEYNTGLRFDMWVI